MASDRSDSTLFYTQMNGKKDKKCEISTYAMLYTLHSAGSKIIVFPHCDNCDITTLKSKEKSCFLGIVNKQMIHTVADNVK